MIYVTCHAARLARTEQHDSTTALKDCVEYLKVAQRVDLAKGTIQYADEMRARPNLDTAPLLLQLVDEEGPLRDVHVLLMSLNEKLESLKAELATKRHAVLNSSKTDLAPEQLKEMTDVELGQHVFKRVAEQKVLDEQLNLETLTEELQSNKKQINAMRKPPPPPPP